MHNWKKILKFNPIPTLIQSNNLAIQYFVKRDLLEVEVEPIETLWALAPVERLVRKQLDDGSWKFSGKPPTYQENKYLFETYKNLGILIEKYGLNKKHVCIKKAAKYLFRCQTEEGDFRGIYCNQYHPNYMSGIIELLNKAGYENDPHIERGFQWLLSMRQDDGGWAIPMRTVGVKWLEAYENSEPYEPVRAKLFSHWVTGIVLRAFAAHSKYRKIEEAKKAGELLISRFFKPDKYPDRRDVSYWTKFSFPFFWTDLLSSLDSLSLLGFSNEIPQIKEALDWFKDKQQENGLWNLKLLRTKDKDLYLWVALAICRVFKRFST